MKGLNITDPVAFPCVDLVATHFTAWCTACINRFQPFLKQSQLKHLQIPLIVYTAKKSP